MGSDNFGRDQSEDLSHTHILGEQHIVTSAVAGVPTVRLSIGTSSAYICLINKVCNAIALGTTYIKIQGDAASQRLIIHNLYEWHLLRNQDYNNLRLTALGTVACLNCSRNDILGDYAERDSLGLYDWRKPKKLARHLS